MTSEYMSETPRLLKKPVVMEMIGLSSAGLYEAINLSGFPAPIKVGPRASRWIESEIREWLQGRKDQRDTRSAGGAV